MSKHSSTGNVFADLGLPDAGLLKLKADLAVKVIKVIEKRGLTQSKASTILGIHQPELSRLKGGDLSHYSAERLLMFLIRLGKAMEIKMMPSNRKPGIELVEA